MRNNHIFATFAFVAIGGLALGSRVGFSAGTLPKGWFAAGSDPQNYEMSVDTSVKHNGRAGAHIKSIGEKPEGFGTLMQIFKADSYRGKRVRMSAWMKSENADSAQLWMRLDGANSKMLGFDNMDNRPVKGTSDWKKYEITLDVPEETANIAFGALVAGKGEAWVDDYELEVGGKDVPTTKMLTPEEEKEFPKDPANLKFEEE